jgi:hypothetical protein
VSRDSVFDWIKEFVTAVKAFQLPGSKGKLAAVFTISDRDDEQRNSVTAPAIESCDNIWSDEKSALLFATAKPPTVATDSHIGVLFFYSFTTATVGGLPTFCALRRLPRKEAPPNKRLLQAADLSLGATASLLSSPLGSVRAGAAMRITSAPPTHSPVQSLSISIWNSRDPLIIFFAARRSFKRATAWALRQKRRIMTKNIGMLLLAIYLILVGITKLFHVGIGAMVMGVLALVAGILILVGK